MSCNTAFFAVFKVYEYNKTLPQKCPLQQCYGKVNVSLLTFFIHFFQCFYEFFIRRNYCFFDKIVMRIRQGIPRFFEILRTVLNNPKLTYLLLYIHCTFIKQELLYAHIQNAVFIMPRYNIIFNYNNFFK